MGGRSAFGLRLVEESRDRGPRFEGVDLGIAADEVRALPWTRPTRGTPPPAWPATTSRACSPRRATAAPRGPRRSTPSLQVAWDAAAPRLLVAMDAAVLALDAHGLVPLGGAQATDLAAAGGRALAPDRRARWQGDALPWAALEPVAGLALAGDAAWVADAEGTLHRAPAAPWARAPRRAHPKP